VLIPKDQEVNQRAKWHQWKQEEITRDLFQLIIERINQKAADWADGRFNGSDLHSFVAENASAQGAVIVLKDLLELDFTDVYQIEGGNDGASEQERDTPNRGSSPYRPGGS
jgi:hypothetical protein